MEDYTYDLTPGQEKILGAHMLEVCPSIADATPTLEIHPLSIGGREDPVRLVFDAAPGPAVVLGLADLGERFRLVANEIDVVRPGRAAAQAAGGARRLASRARPAPSRPRRGSPRAARTTRCCRTAIGAEELHDLAEMARTELVVIDADTTTTLRRRAALEPGVLPPGPGFLTRPAPPAPPTWQTAR